MYCCVAKEIVSTEILADLMLAKIASSGAKICLSVQLEDNVERAITKK